jgi:aromatic ring-opening dioxygenase catalytic subunit (LigB family)
VVPFDKGLQDAVGSKPEKRRENMMALKKREDINVAHPTLEHLLPIYIAAGAAGECVGEQPWTTPQASIGWAQYRFRNVVIG